MLNRRSVLGRFAVIGLASMVTIAGLTAGGCEKKPNAATPASTTIKIGHYGSLTGSEATFGQSTDRGIRLAVKEINAKGTRRTDDDYLELRPTAEPRVRAQVQAGRLRIGPLYTQADTLLCDGESLIRNLARGIRRGDALGGATRLGYMSDQFGHAAQVPQVLRVWLRYRSEKYFGDHRTPPGGGKR